MKCICLLAGVMFTVSVQAQKYYEIDLAKKTQVEQTIGLDYKGVRIKNKLPFKDYLIKIEVEQELNSGTDKNLSGADNCIKEEPYSTARKALLDEKDETNVPTHLKTLKSHVETAKAECKASLQKDFAELEAATVEDVPFTFDVKKNQNIIVTITKPSEKKVMVILRTPRQVNYITHFGFTFIPNGEKNSDNYYSKADTGSTFLITPMNKNGADFWKDVSITANFIVFPFKYKNPEADIKLGLMGGFGIGGDARFSVFAGPSIVVKDFISLNLGAGLYHKTRLKGQYSSGQRLQESLDFDQLHERGARPAFTISLGLRLSKEQVQEGVEVIGGGKKPASE